MMSTCGSTTFKFAAALWWASMLWPAVSGFCPRNCQCTNDPPAVDCEGAALAHIPIMLNPRIVSLNLRNNSISHVTLDELSLYTELEYLDLSHNRILRVERGAFFRMTKLKGLTLRANLIATLELDMFAGLSDLRSLDIADNGLRRVPTSVFSDLRQLESLNLSGNDLRQMSEGALVGLSSLKELHLQRNDLSRVPRTALRAVTELRLLDLSFNDFTFIQNESFVVLTQLQSLNLAGNLVDGIADNAFVGLLNLRDLSLQLNSFVRMPTMSFRVLSELTSLNVADNLFEEISTSAFEGLARLRLLTISQCKQLRNVAVNAFSGLYELETLVLSDNPSLERFDPFAFENDSHLRQMFLGANNLSTLPERLVRWQQLQTLDLSGNPLHCDCKLAWLPAALAQIEAHAGERSQGQFAVCHEPKSLRGQPVQSLAGDDLHCAGENSVTRRLIFDVAITVGVLLVGITLLGILVLTRHRILNCWRRHRGAGIPARHSFYEGYATVPATSSDWYDTGKRPHMYRPTTNPYYGRTGTLEHEAFLSNASDYSSASLPKSSVGTDDTYLSRNSRDGSFRIITEFPVPITEL